MLRYSLLVFLISTAIGDALSDKDLKSSESSASNPIIVELNAYQRACYELRVPDGLPVINEPVGPKQETYDKTFKDDKTSYAGVVSVEYEALNQAMTSTLSAVVSHFDKYGKLTSEPDKVRESSKSFYYKTNPGDSIKICLINHDRTQSNDVFLMLSFEKGLTPDSKINLAARKISKTIQMMDTMSLYIEHQHSSHIITATAVLHRLYVSCFVRIIIHIIIGIALKRIFKKMFEVRSFI